MSLSARIRDQRGQGLLETIIAIGVIMASTIGTITLVSSTNLAGREVSNKVVAVSLAREGIEVVRNIRDSNWLKIQANENVQTFQGIFDGVNHAVVPVFDKNLNAWSLETIANGDFDTVCGSGPNARNCSFVYRSPGSVQYVQYVIGAVPGPATKTIYQRYLTLNPLCRKDSNNDGLPDVNQLTADELILSSDGETCPTNPTQYVLVGVQVLSRVAWNRAVGDSCPSKTCYELEDRIYNWKYVK